MIIPTIFFSDVSATRNTLRLSFAKSFSHESYILPMFGRNEYLAGSHDSCSAQTFSTIGRTAGTSAGVAGRISISGSISIPYRHENSFHHRPRPHPHRLLLQQFPPRPRKRHRRHAYAQLRPPDAHDPIRPDG